MDYVDDHFYVDHPQFIERSWRLPSRCPNTSPIAGGASGGRHVTFTRLFDKPFTVSEYNYSGPGRYRGVGGILTGSMGAIQGWGAIWRFAYAHNREDLVRPGRLDYFNMATDPLSQAAERASICLFLRGDMRAGAAQRDSCDDDARSGRATSTHSAFGTRLALGRLGDPRRHVTGDGSGDTALSGCCLASGVGKRRPARIRGPKWSMPGILMRSPATSWSSCCGAREFCRTNNPTDPDKNVFQCETGEITIDAPQDVMTLDTPRTAGGFAPAGVTIRTTHGVEFAVQDTDATVWVSALDDQPITASNRLLVTHLTDLQNTGIRVRGTRATDAVGVGPIAAPGPRRQGGGPPATGETGCLSGLGTGDQREAAGRSSLACFRGGADVHGRRGGIRRPRSRALLRNRASEMRITPFGPRQGY